MTATALEPATPRTGSGLRVAIHQPNLLPWTGFFAKCMQADVLVLLDDVPFSRGSYTNRVRVMGPKGPTWLTVPVAHPCSGVPIDQVMVSGPNAWTGAVARLAAWYPSADLGELLDGMNTAATFAAEIIGGAPIAHTNAYLIGRVLVALVGGRMFMGDTVVTYASELRSTPEPSTAGLIQLCKAVGATTYVAGNGSGYEDLPAFEAAGIEFTRAQFRHPEYPQRRPAGMEFVPGLSIVDVLANVGVEETRRLLGEAIR